MGKPKTVFTFTMKHSLFLCVVLIAALGPAVEAFFLGPIAVGVGLGALAVTKGLILGSILGQSRTNERGGRSYTLQQNQSLFPDQQLLQSLHSAKNVLLLLTKIQPQRQE